MVTIRIWRVEFPLKIVEKMPFFHPNSSICSRSFLRRLLQDLIEEKL